VYLGVIWWEVWVTAERQHGQGDDGLLDPEFSSMSGGWRRTALAIAAATTDTNRPTAAMKCAWRTNQ
jgi:hypothetical protein